VIAGFYFQLKRSNLSEADQEEEKKCPDSPSFCPDDSNSQQNQSPRMLAKPNLKEPKP